MLVAARRRYRTVLAAMAALVVPLATVAVVASAAPAGAATCTDPLHTRLTIVPATATEVVGDQHTVAVHEECDGVAGAGDAIRMAVRGVNTVNARALTDAAGNLRFSYWDDEGAGEDTITACTDLPGPNVCTRAAVEWACDPGLFASGISCSRIPPLVLPFDNVFETVHPGLSAPFFGGTPGTTGDDTATVDTTLAPDVVAAPAVVVAPETAPAEVVESAPAVVEAAPAEVVEAPADVVTTEAPAPDTTVVEEPGPA